MNAKSVNEVFLILDKYWNYTNYALLQYLVQKFGESALKEEMSECVASLENFEKKTTTLESSIAARNGRYPQKFVWGHFELSRVMVKLPRDPAVCTLLPPLPLLHWYAVDSASNPILKSLSLGTGKKNLGLYICHRCYTTGHYETAHQDL